MSASSYATQNIEGPLTATAIFLTVTVVDHDEADATVCETVAGLEDLVKNVGDRKSVV